MTVPVPEEFKLSRPIREGLPAAERDSARESLWEKSGGVCALCGEPLPPDGKGVDVDHTVAQMEGAGGETTLSNLYLAHRSCNRSRQNLPFDLASRVIRFSRWCAAQPRRSFDDVIGHYLSNGNQRVRVSMHDSEVLVKFGTVDQRAPVYVDPATGTPYFFMNAPVDFVRNDTESQPRYIEHDHVRTLATDFSVHPVHEPSNCRVVPVGDAGLADLLQFDGQHKTTAQIVLGRTDVPMKFYYDPSEPMIQELVVQIQQGIKKRPLSTTDTLRKLDDVVKDKVEAFKAANGGRAPTEIELVAAQPRQDQTSFKKRLLSNFEFAVLNDGSLLLSGFASKKAARLYPLTDTMLVRRMIRPFISQELLDEPLDQALQRETERETVVRLLNRVAENMLVDKWKPKNSNDQEDLVTRRARNFFYQAAIGWWLGEVLMTSISLIIPRARWKKPFVEPLTVDQEERIDAYVDALCSWPIWSTTDQGQLAALRSNTVTNVSKAFPDYDHTRLIKESQ